MKARLLIIRAAALSSFILTFKNRSYQHLSIPIILLNFGTL
jgi:hypothetical protein